MRKYFVEAIGTMIFVLTIVLVVAHAGTLAPLAIWSILMILVYVWGHISGGHYNPAVSLAVRVRGKLGFSKMIWYWAAQLVGAMVGALIASYLLGSSLTPATLSSSTGQIILAEFMFTFVLARVVLHVATDKEVEGNNYFGLAIWFSVLAGAFAVGAISGGSFNPAVSIWGAIAGIFSWNIIWMHLIGQVLGALFAWQLYTMVSGKKS